LKLGQSRVTKQLDTVHLRSSFGAACENKCASPSIGEPFGEYSVGGKWLMGELLRIPLTLLGHGYGALGGGEMILLNCYKRLQISRTFFQVVTVLAEEKLSGSQPTPNSGRSLPPSLAPQSCDARSAF
jgi:hypothetical protein